jgi:hypothetical protein
MFWLLQVMMMKLMIVVLIHAIRVMLVVMLVVIKQPLTIFVSPA